MVIFKKLKKLVLPVVAQVQWQTGTLVSTLATAMDRLQKWQFLREMNGKNMEYWDRNMEYIDYEQESETLEWLRCEKRRCADIYQDQVKKARAESHMPDGLQKPVCQRNKSARATEQAVIDLVSDD